MRDGAEWNEREREPGATLALPSIGAELTFTDFYEDVDFAS